MTILINYKCPCLTSKFFAAVLFPLLLLCCKKREGTALPEIKSFKIEAAKNTSLLGSDLEGAINEKNISITIPANITLTDVIVSFEHTGDGVYVNDTRLQSGTSTVTIAPGTVLAVRRDGFPTVNYSVTVTHYPDPELVLTSFTIEKKNNPGFAKDVIFTVKTDSVEGELNMADKEAIPSFVTTAMQVSIGNMAQVSGASKVDFSTPVSYTLHSSKGFKKNYAVKVNFIAGSLSHIYIMTDGNTPVVSKEDYLNATIRVDGKGLYEDYYGTTKIKGRGNTTWSYPKKPYRLKLDTKAGLFGLSAEKDWVLLANYLDPTLTLNAVALKTAQQLGMPFTNHAVPVDLNINGIEMGSYTFTEQVEVEKNRVNVGDGGVLLEMDAYSDEPFKFRSIIYNLPVMLKYPEISMQAELDPVKNYFNEFEALVGGAGFPASNYLNYVDATSLADYLLVFLLCDNEEINHPKSIYLHKTATGKYNFGPVWDFDWAFGYEGSQTHFTSATRPLFWTGTPAASDGTRFFLRFLSDPAIVLLLKQRWASYKAGKLPELLNYIDGYADKIEVSRKADHLIWGRGSSDFRGEITALKNWLRDRAGYIDIFLQTL